MIKLLWGKGMLIIFIMMIIPWVYVKTYHIIHFKYVQFIVSQLNLKKDIWPGTVVHVYSPTYLGDCGRRII
jgi:hypothetical protein